MKKYQKFVVSMLALLTVPPLGVAQSTDFEAAPWARIERFRDMYSPYLGKGNDLVTKIIDNKGNGYEPLYGLRNMRVVLHGVMYRGGANNAFHRTNKRSNTNPMPQDGLENLCHESFGEAIYLYEKNYEPQTVECKSRTGNLNTLTYSQISVLGTPINGNPNQFFPEDFEIDTRGNGVRDILERVHTCATGVGSCPVYTHCWNGWHASGLISAVALRQFCDFSPDAAVQYWVDATDSLENSNYPAIKKAIRDFLPIEELRISADIKAKICPKNPYQPIRR
jgi:hypothetical protein